MKREVLKRFLIFTFFFFLLIIGYYCYKESKEKFVGDPVTFNKESGFYSETIKVKLYKNIDLPIGSEIYYTLDGNDPTKNSNKYKKAIELKLVEGEIKVYPLKVVAYYKDKYTNIVEKTYVVDRDIKNNNIDIISITSDSHNLYDYYKGIMVPGITHDESVKRGVTGDIPGNYSNRGDDWLRNSNMVMFNEDGKVLIDKKIKLGISGDSSAIGYKTKSLKVDSRATSDRKKFEFIFYDDDFFANYSLVNKYNTLRLRSGSQDMKNGNIRSSVISKLCAQSNYGGCTTTNRSIVFLNGEFYGLVDLQQTYSKSTLANKYSLNDSSKIQKTKSSESGIFKTLDLKKYFLEDLNEQENRDELENVFDMDEYILYMGIQILISNSDWPQRNYEIWRYTGEYNESNKYTDGRYRTLLFDLDETYYYNNAGNVDVFKTIMEEKYKAKDSVEKRLLSTKYYRDKYVMVTQDLLNTSFKEENILAVIDQEKEKIRKAFKANYTEEEYENWENRINLLETGVKEHDMDLLNDFKEYFGLEEKHKVNIKSNEGIQINFSNQELYQNKEYTNEYYRNIDLRFKYKEYPGYKFEYWLVNDERIYDTELVIESEKYRDVDEINIEAVSKYSKKDNHLLITEVYAKGDSDWIKITNTGKDNIKLNNYYLSDRENKLEKYQLPNAVLEPNESIIVNGNKNYYSVGDYICNFNMSEEEKIVLSKGSVIIDSIIVPKMSEIETYGRYDNSNTFKFYMNNNSERKRID